MTENNGPAEQPASPPSDSTAADAPNSPGPDAAAAPSSAAAPQDPAPQGPADSAPGATWQPRPSGALSAPHDWQAPVSPWQPPSGQHAGSPGATPSGPQWSPPLSQTPVAHHFVPGGAPGFHVGPGYRSATYGAAPGTPYPPGGIDAAGPLGPAGPARPATDAAKPPARRGRTALVLLAAAVIGLGAGFGGGILGHNFESTHESSATPTLAQQSSNQPASNESPAPAGSVQEVARKVLPSVVSVVALSNQGESEGSGVILTSSGLILTNNHVIDGARTLTVQLNDGTTAEATVIGTDPVDDLAVLSIKGTSGLTPATLGTSADVEVGQEVVAVGSPLGLSATVTSGIVSALNRPVRTESAESQQSQGTVLSAIQTDAAINPGNSGGPLVDMDGNVIGINSAIAALTSGSDGQSGSIGVGFAIPIDQARRIAQEIIDNGQATHAVLGASVTSATDRSKGIQTGAEIAKVTPDSGADKAGLKAGDVVTKVDDVPIESADALVAAIRASKPGGTVEVTYVRDEQSHTVSVTLGASKD